MDTLLISFHSDTGNETYYKDNAVRLIKECEALRIPYDIREKESLGSYRLNCLSKPQYILDTINKLDQPVLWMDADTKIHKSLDIFDQFYKSADMAAATDDGKILGIKASPLYFSNTAMAKKFLSAWIEVVECLLSSDEELFDHEPLFGLIYRYAPKMNIEFVGREYCTWPGDANEKTYVTMGLAEGDSKQQSLLKSRERQIRHSSQQETFVSCLDRHNFGTDSS